MTHGRARALPPPLTPPHKGEGDSEPETLGRTGSSGGEALTTPSPLWGGVRGGGIGPQRPYSTDRLGTV